MVFLVILVILVSAFTFDGEPAAFVLFYGLVAPVVGITAQALRCRATSDPDQRRLSRTVMFALALGLALALVIIGGSGFLATRPKGTTGPLENPVVIGKQPFFSEPLPPVSARARTGALGTVSDIEPGFTLYAQSGALAGVLGVLPGSSDFGKRFAGFFYAKGMHGASDELWIPFEAVMSVYPETQSAFLAIKGDETEHFGWNVPPESVRRGPARGVHEL